MASLVQVCLALEVHRSVSVFPSAVLKESTHTMGVESFCIPIGIDKGHLHQ